MTDWGLVYADCVDATARVAESLSDDELTRPVPATPDWTVRDVLGHAAGAPADALAGRMDGAPSPAWTARHVAERADRTVAELLAELRAGVADVAEMVEGAERPALVWDKAVHLADLHEALGLGVAPDATWRPVVDNLAAGRLAHLPVTLRCGDATYGAGGPEAEVSPYELFRAVFSRRSRGQLRSWAGDASDEQLDAIGIFGPREDDQPVP